VPPAISEIIIVAEYGTLLEVLQANLALIEDPGGWISSIETLICAAFEALNIGQMNKVGGDRQDDCLRCMPGYHLWRACDSHQDKGLWHQSGKLSCLR
jgi:hypothetical protein